MITLSRQIEILLLDHDCVILPDFGAFIANHAVARMSDKGDALMLPPYRVVGFNQEVKSNDGLLAQAYMDAYDANYPDAYRQMEMDIEDMVGELDSKGEYVFNGVGTLYKDIDGKVTFSPLEAGLLTPSLYGLYSVEVHDVEELIRQQEIRLAVENTVTSPIQTTVDSQKVAAAKTATLNPEEDGRGDIVIRLHRRWVDVAVAAVAAVFFFFIFSYPAMNTPGAPESVSAGSVSVKPVKKAADMPKTEQRANLAESSSATADTETTSPAMGKGFVIVLASKVSEKNAEMTVKLLKDKGLDQAHVIGSEKMRRVVYSNYPTEEEANNARKLLRTQHELFAQSWIMELQ